MLFRSEEEYANKEITAEEIKEELEEIVFSRNENWAEQIPRIIESKSTFFAVCALHLPTERGVIQLLRNKGFRVEPVE